MTKRTNGNFYKFLLLCGGGFIAAIGSGMTAFGLGVYVFEQTGLASAATLITLCAFLPGLLLSPLAGVLADRHDRRLLMILGDGLSAVGLVYILMCMQMQSGGARLWQIAIGVTVSSVFSSLIEPSFKATISDLLTEEEYSKASGLVQLINSARFLISPVIAGALLAAWDITLLLVIDGCTLILTILATFVVRKGLISKDITHTESILRAFKTGWSALTKERGVFALTVTGIAISFFIGCIQCLYTPMLLGFTNSSVLGTATTICASGMLFSSILLGMRAIKRCFAKILSTALFSAGLCMAGFGFRENIIVICIFGFLFFAALPFANTAIDYLLRTNIPNEVQGRVWGLIGIISQFGYIIAYGALGPLADAVFVPSLKEGGALADSVGRIIGTGSGRGIGLLIIICGLLLAITAIVLYRVKSIRAMERNGERRCTMYGKLIINDIRKGKLIAITITTFIMVAAALTSVAAMLGVNLFGAIDHLMDEAKAPHFLQMHSGYVDKEQLQNFADTQGNVEAYQLALFLNVDGSDIVIGENSLENSIQDNGFAAQNPEFDFLLDLNGDVIQPADGEVYVPLGYMKDGSAKMGDKLTVRDVSFTVAGFLRDSQMNSDLAGSKRFLVSENDFAEIESFGSIEYLIEFRLNDAQAFPAFQSDYFAAGLPSNGPPAISRQLFMMMNAITDGMMIAVLVLISVLVIIVAFLCIRFTLLAKIEEDYREIGVLKAVGMRISQIGKLYAAKYGAIAGLACILGFLLSMPLSIPLMENIRLFMGESGRDAIAPLIGAIGGVGIFLVIMLYVKTVLRRFRRISAAEAVRFGAPQEKSKTAKLFCFSKNRLFSRNIFLGIKDVLSRKKLYITMFTVLVISSFILIVPQNIYSTISARSFMTYMGVGESDLLAYVTQTQTDGVRQAAEDISAALAVDESISKYTVFSTLVFSMPTEGGRMERLRVDLGDHTAFPVMYSDGGAPTTNTEIALSGLYADELGKTLGDKLTLIVDGVERHLTVCGIYSDITNAGKTAKAVFEAREADLLRIAIPIKLSGSTAASEMAARVQAQFPYASVSAADEYMRQMFGSTLDAIQKASVASIAATILLTVLVTLLFMKMLVAKDRYSIAILKSLGFTGKDISRQYVTRSLLVAILGIVIGVILANTLGETVGAALISSFGATAFKFVVNPLYAYLFAPILIAVCVYAATLLGVADIGSIKISEHIKGA